MREKCTCLCSGVHENIPSLIKCYVLSRADRETESRVANGNR